MVDKENYQKVITKVLLWQRTQTTYFLLTKIMQKRRFAYEAADVAIEKCDCGVCFTMGEYATYILKK